LPAYGHGDWNDSLQPLDPTMREHMCSSWTATLHYQTFRELAAAVARLGHNATAARLDAAAERIREDFRRLLLVDDTLTGYAYFGSNGRIDYLLHPRDQASGVRYSVLAMIHAIIADLLSPDEARAHVAIIRKHLLGPDGAHLFDRPFRYRGGVQSSSSASSPVRSSVARSATCTCMRIFATRRRWRISAMPTRCSSRCARPTP
jgi:cellobiose phosphorylase